MAEMTVRRAVGILHAKASDLEARIKPRLSTEFATDLDWLMADVALIAGIASEMIERIDARLAVLEDRMDNIGSQPLHRSKIVPARSPEHSSLDNGWELQDEERQ